MKKLACLIALILITSLHAEARPSRYVELLPYVQAGPDQGETNTCLFMASTGVMELLLNRQHKIKAPKKNGRFDLAESFLIWQEDYYDRENPSQHFIDAVVKKFNHGEAIQHKQWQFNAYYPDKTDSMEGWNKHPDFQNLPRISVPKVKTELLFSKGRKYAMNVLTPEDIELMKQKMFERKAPLIVNYNDDGYWHVVLIVGYDDKRQGTCYEIEKEDCKKGSFYVRDSNGKRWERRAYNWFLEKGNAAALVELK